MLTDKELIADDSNSERFDEERQESAELRQSVESAVATDNASADADADFEESRSHLEELTRRYGGRSAAEVVNEALQLDAEMRRDPMAGTEKLLERYIRLGPIPKAEPVSDEGPYGLKETKLPSGAVNTAAEGSIARDIAQAMAKGKNDSDYRAARDAFRKLYPGESFSGALKAYLERDTQLRSNPTHWAARIGSTYGLPLSADEAREHEANRSAAVRAQQEVAQFAADKINYPRFEELRQGMAESVRLGATTFHDAYQLAASVADELAALTHKHSDWKSFKPQILALVQSGKAKDLEAAYFQAKAEAPKPQEQPNPKPKKGNDLRSEIRAQLARARR